MTNLEETLVVSFGTSEPLPFPEVYPALTQPVPAGDQLLAEPEQTYTWPSYSGTAGTATHMTLEITATDEEDEYFAEYDAAINGSASFTPPTVPLGQYDLELAFFFRQNTQTPGGTLVECANERYARYALSIQDPPLTEFMYVTNNTMITITGYTGEGSDVIIPELIDGLPVTGIADYAFAWNNSLTNVLIPASITYIGNNVFNYCPYLDAIEVAEGNLFYSSLDGVLFDAEFTTLLRYPEGRVGDYAVPEGVEHIADRAFYYCLNNLTGVTLPPSVISIGGEAFSMCYGLAVAELSTNVVSIGQSAFSQCNSLGEIILPNSVTNLGDSAFLYCSSLTNVVLPEGLATIGFQVFHSCSSLEQIEIPASVTSISQGAFAWCGSLLGMELPEGLTSIGNSAFSYCGSLTNIAIPYGVTSIGDYAFHWCPGLSGMIIPGSVSSIGYAAFAQCGGLSSLILSNGVVSIGESAFASCVNLTNIMIPASVTSIGQWAFSQCAQLASIEVAGANTNYSSQDGVLFNKDQTQLLLCPEGKTGGYAIPSGVETIQNNAFQYCTHVTDISIPDSVTVLGPAAFAGCSSLTNVLIGSGISQIEDSVFSSCTSMGSLLIPANVTLIGNGAFYGCSTLTNVVIAGNVSHLGYMAFYGCSQLATLVLPASLESLGDYAFGYCSALESLYFWGNVPGFVGVEPFYYASETLTVYYLAGATGWGPTFADRPAALWLFELSATKGPYSGGNSITISNGSFGTVTNVLVGGVAATITASGNNWVTVTVSACGSPGVKDIVLQTSEHGDITLTGVYTVNPAGVIGVDQRAAVAAGGYHALSLKSDNSIVAWGRDIEGQTTVPSPNIDFSGVAGGYYHSLGRKSDGSIVAWGLNANGQATVPSPNVDFVAVAAGTYHSLGVKSDSSIVAWGRNSDGQTIVPSPNANFVAVAGGYGHSLGLKSDGRIVAWGSNSNGQTNVPSPNTGFVSVAAGFYHSLGLKSDGSIVAWGANGNGQTTVSSPNADFVAVAGGVYHSVGLKADGSVVAWGENSYGQTNVPSPNTDFVAVAAGYAYSLGLKSDGRIVVWGYNSNGQTNVPPPNSSFGFPAGVQPSSGLRTGGYDVVISGTNLGNGSDITEVTLCGVPAAIVSQSSTQVVVTAGAGTPGNGDVVVSSTSYGVTTKTDGFTYLKTDQTINFPAISDKLTTDAVVLSATALSGLPVSFSLASGPAVINNGTNLAFTGAGTVSIVASQPGDANWNAAPNVTNTFEVTQPVIEYQLTVSNGTGSGAYTNGAVVAIAADEPAFGKMFDCWTGDTQSVASVTSASTTVTMPDGPVTVTATYKLIPVEPAYSDGFEASQLNPFWVPSLQNGTITPSSDRAHTGSQSAKFSAPGGGQKWLYLRHFFDRPQYGTVSVWVYDSMQYIYFGMQVQNSALGSWGAGIYNWDWDYGTFYYTSSMSDGSAVKSAVGRFAGWRKFTIRSLKNELVLDVDGQEMYRGPGVAPFDRIQLHLSGPGSGTIYFDDFSFTPEIEGRVETPTFEPLPGTVFTNQAVVALACATTGASIRYTTDGSEPTEASALYETGLLLTKTTPLKARAFKASYYPSETASAMFTRAYTLADAVDCRDLLFRTGGEAPWFIQSAVVGEGTDAAQSGAIGHRQSSWMETSVEGPGILSFRWKLSCEDDELLDDWDYVAVIVNGVEVARRDGITEWELVQVPLEAGVNTVRWVYTKDRVVSEGMDCAWVDGVSWTPASQETQTTPVPVPHLWLDLYTLVLNGDYETAAFSDDDGDGHEAWEEFVAGTYPDDPESVLRVHIHFENGLPVVTWDPDLGESRTYVVEGRSSLSEGEWEPASEGHRFFRVKVDLP
jgi:7-cyano-7-deazaguanine synthase in queuosine biosynthesis